MLTQQEYGEEDDGSVSRSQNYRSRDAYKVRGSISPGRKIPVPLYKKIERKYEKEESQFTLADHKKKLEELRTLKAPVGKKELDKFNHEYLELRRYKLKEINQKRQETAMQIMKNESQLPSYTDEKKA